MDLNAEVQHLKEANVDLIRLLTGNRKLTDIALPQVEETNEPLQTITDSIRVSSPSSVH